MDLSVIIINYNTRHLTLQCLQSIYAKTSGLNFEVILVDNASVECDPIVFKEAYPDITLIRSEVNTGFSGGNNMGIAVAKGDYYILLNSDTELLNNALYLGWQEMKADPSIGVLSGQLQYPDGRLQYPASHFPSIGLEAALLTRIYGLLPSHIRRRWYLSDQWNHHHSTEADWVWGAYFMVPRYVIRQLPGGRLPDDFFMYVEDMQWCYAIRQLGYHIWYSSVPKCIHHIGGSAKKEDRTPEQEIDVEFRKAIANQVIFLSKAHGPWYPIVLFKLRAWMLWSTRQPINRLRASRYHALVAGLISGTNSSQGQA